MTRRRLHTTIDMLRQEAMSQVSVKNMKMTGVHQDPAYDVVTITVMSRALDRFGYFDMTWIEIVEAGRDRRRMRRLIRRKLKGTYEKSLPLVSADPAGPRRIPSGLRDARIAPTASAYSG